MRRFLTRFALTGILAILLMAVVLHLLAKAAPGCTVCAAAGERPLVIAHQGGDGERPSNTLLAFENAVQAGADMLEMDVHATADGVLVLSHDEALGRLTDGSGLIKEKTLAELQTIDAAYNWSPLDDGAEYPYRGQGVQIPTLAEVFDAFAGMPMNIEIKQAEPPIAQLLCAEIRAAGMSERVLVASFRQTALEEFREVCPEVETSLGEDEVRDFFYRHLAFFGNSFSPGGLAVQVPIEREGWTLLTPRFVRTAQRRGMDVHAWTINDEAEMRALIEMGVDGLITDYPSRLRALLDE